MTIARKSKQLHNYYQYLTPIASTINKASGWFPGGQFTTPQYICPTFAGGVRLLSWGSNPQPPWQIQHCPRPL